MDMDGVNHGCGEDCDMEGCECGADGCEECEWWRQHCYWSHAGDHPRYFSLVAGDAFRDHMRIRLPVASHLRNFTEFEEIQLEAPNGHGYPIKIGWEFGDIVLRSGWHDFVMAHHIEQNYSVRFMYRGNSSFKVHISGSSGHDNSSPPPPRIFRAISPCTPHDCHVLNEQVVPDPAHVQTSTDFGYTAFHGTCLSHEQEKKVLVLDPSGCEKTCFDMGNSSNAREGCCAQAQNMASTSFRWAKSGLQARESNEAGLEAPRSNNYISTLRTPLRSQQEEKVEERVRAIGSEFPVFVKVITVSDVVTSSSLYLGADYASACLLTKPGRLRLLLEGDERDWDCRLGLRKSSKTWWIDKAWPKFISDVGLEKDDICLFELTDTSNLTMKVHVIRKSDVPAP